MKKTKLALLHSVIALILCCSMLIGTTFAWFTDVVQSGVNHIVAGNLDVELEYLDKNGAWKSVDGSTEIFDPNALWEPGYTEVIYLRVSNKGDLALKYQLGVNIVSETGSTNKDGEDFLLSDHIRFGVVQDVTTRYATREDARKAVTASTIISEGYSKADSIAKGGADQYVALVVWMPEETGNEANYMTGVNPPKIELGINLVATQQMAESDSFGPTYDEQAKFPEINLNVTVSAPVTNVDGKVASEVKLASQSGGIAAIIPEGVALADGVTELTLTVNTMKETGSNVTLGENEQMQSVDVHVEGVAEGNTVPMIIDLGAILPKGLNMGNYKLFHVEGDQTITMTHVENAADLDAHNEFTYDPATGNVTVALASFSEIAVAANMENAWNGIRDYSWYDASKTDFVIANADQLAGFGAIVGGMAKTADNVAIEQDSFSGKTVKLICNINIGDLISDNGKVFYPIGYYNDEGNYEKSNKAITSGFKTFEGTFDGNGHTISNWYQNTWEMKGDHNWYAPEDQHYRDGMGLFGKVYGGTVKNLTVKNFSSDGEIATTGVIAAYADCGAIFENIAIFDCNPRVYNIGNGGIVGCVGWYANDTHTTPVTFKNITVDNTNKISALWGSWDVACGGLVGQYYPTSGQENASDNGGIYMENCHVAAQIDVYNDVCANYQYYAYRYAGILIGSVRENVEQNGHIYPNMDGISAKDCTVHFGDWNDYYYCELVANSLASYTHDHQMSRLEQVASVDVANMKVVTLEGETKAIPTSGAANYVVVRAKDANGMWIHGDGAEYATCYHFVDGKAWNHADAGKETVDGVEVLKEDKQLIYREFNNLVTGYGWGVTSKGVGEMEGVTILDREEGNSYEKFVAQETISEEYRAHNERAIGRLFKAATIADPKLAIKSANVVVTVSPKVGTNSTAGGIYTPNASDWTKGTIMFTGAGEAVITITDYYYCKSTTVEVMVVANDVTGLSVKTNKNLYDISKSETFSASDITVTAVYSDGIARTLNVGDYTYEFEAGTDFGTFGEKKGIVSYTYAEKTVTAEFKVVAVNMQELTLAGVDPEVDPETGEEKQRIQRYFEQFGINAVGQKYFTMPGVGAEGLDLNKYGTAASLSFATGSVNYTINSHAGMADTVTYPDAHGQITINCTSAPFADIYGYVGYADRVPIAFGVYVDTVDNLTYTAPMEANADIQALTGTENARIFYIQAPLNTMNLSVGEHKVHFISIFDDGVQPLTTWTVNIAEKEEVDISQKTANVIILAGQSNAYGASALTEAVKGAAAGADYSNIFINYSNINCENGVWKSLYYNSGFESYHPGVGGTLDGACFGPEVGIAYQLATNEATKDEVWYIIKYTAAGTMLDGQWLEGTYDSEGLVQDMGDHLSDLMIDYVEDSLAKIMSIHGENINVHSFIWMQGESDSLAEDCAQKYQKNEAELVNKVRSQFAQYANHGNGDNIIFVSGAIAKLATIDITLTGESASNGWTYSDIVNNGKKANALIEWEPVSNTINNPTSNILSNSVWIDTSSLLVGANAGENNDVYHYSSASMYNLGNWFGIAINYVDGLGLNNVEPGSWAVNYDANGGTCGTASNSVKEGDSVTLPTATRDGYTFTGWSDGATTYAAGASYTPTADVTLTAQWEPIAYKITINASGVTPSDPPTEAYYGDTITIKLKQSSFSMRDKTVTISYSNGAQSQTATISGWNQTTTVTLSITMPAEDLTITIS